MSAGRGEGAGLAAASGAAVVVPPEQPQELAAALARVCGLTAPERAALGERGRAFVCPDFDRSVVTDEFIGRLEALQASGSR